MPRLILTALLALLATVLPAKADPALRAKLESVYSKWQSAMLAKNYKGYTAVTAKSRQAMTRNIIVSQKKPFPRALFEVPMDPPPLQRLRLLKTEVDNDTAVAVYYGKVVFGAADRKIPENILVLDFIREEGRWKFNRTRFVNLGPEIRDRVSKGDLAFLSEPDFSPFGQVPQVPATFPVPDFAGYVEITSIGYETRVEINTAYENIVSQDISSSLLIGGLKEGENSIRIETVALDEPAEKKFKIEVFVLRERERKPPARIFVYEPETVPAKHEAPLWANAVTIR